MGEGCWGVRAGGNGRAGALGPSEGEGLGAGGTGGCWEGEGVGVWGGTALRGRG